MVPDEEAGQTDRLGASTAFPLLAGHPLNGRLRIPSSLPSAPLFSQEVTEIRGFLSREKPWGPRSLWSSVVVQLQPEPPAQTLASQSTRCSFHSWSALPFVNLKPSSHGFLLNKEICERPLAQRSGLCQLQALEGTQAEWAQASAWFPQQLMLMLLCWVQRTRQKIPFTQTAVSPPLPKP